MSNIRRMVAMSICLVLVTQFSLVEPDATFIAEACESTRLPDLCRSILDYNPSHRSTDDMGSLVNILLDVIVLRSNFVIAIIQGKPAGFSPSCNKGYSLILSDYVERVRKALPGDAKIALEGVHAIDISATLCRSFHAPTTPINELCMQVRNLAEIAAALIMSLMTIWV